MVMSALWGFLIGVTLPAVGSRFGKILPADPGLVLLRLWHRPHFPDVPDVRRTRKLKQLWYRLGLCSLFWGIVLAGLFTAADRFIGGSEAVWAMIFCAVTCICIIIDKQYFLLPDFFTVPLLLLGVSAAVFTDLLPVEYSLLGAFFGYLVSVISVFLVGLICKAEFGGGDVKMVTAIGAWLGVSGLNFTLLLSFFLFALQAIIQSKRNGAFGPALGTAAIITLFIIYSK